MGGMLLNKRLGNFLFLHQNVFAKKPCKNDSTCLDGFTAKSHQCLCSAGFGSDLQ